MSGQGKQSQKAGAIPKSFELLKKDRTTTLTDPESEAGTCLYIHVTEEGLYCCRPDKDIIKKSYCQRACDYCLYAKNRPQVCFVEFKGANVKAGKKENPYDQILATVTYFRTNKSLSFLVDAKTDKHAFIVSPARQRIPAGIDIRERQLQKALTVGLSHGKETENRVHYVRVLRQGRNSDDGKHIVCSGKAPLLIPYALAKQEVR